MMNIREFQVSSLNSLILKEILNSNNVFFFNNWLIVKKEQNLIRKFQRYFNFHWKLNLKETNVNSIKEFQLFNKHIWFKNVFSKRSLNIWIQSNKNQKFYLKKVELFFKAF